MSRYLSAVQNSHRAELTTGYVHHRFALQAAADPARSWLVGSRARTHLARVVVTPGEHLRTMINIHQLNKLIMQNVGVCAGTRLINHTLPLRRLLGQWCGGSHRPPRSLSYPEGWWTRGQGSGRGWWYHCPAGCSHCVPRKKPLHLHSREINFVV